MQPSTSASLLATEFAALHQQLRGGADRSDVLNRVVDLAVARVPGCGWAGLTSWPLNQSPRSVAATGEVVGRVDKLQDEAGEGPGLTAIVDDEPTLLADVNQPGGRWPVFAAAAHAQSPVRGVLAFPIGHDTDRMALNLYTTTPGWFDPAHGNSAAIDLSGQFAAHARGLLLHAHTSHQNTHLQIALTSSRQIGAAIGILMATYKITSEQAFASLRRVSQQSNTKLRDLADTVIATGQLPT